VGGERAARCLSEKRARKRAARGEDSDVRIVRRARTVGSEGAGVLKIDILIDLKECMFQCQVGCWSGYLGRDSIRIIEAQGRRSDKNKFESVPAGSSDL
jgi:hypothetical protein